MGDMGETFVHRGRHRPDILKFLLEDFFGDRICDYKLEFVVDVVY